MSFLDASPTSSQAAEEIARLLDRVGFLRLDEKSSWKLALGENYYLIRRASIVAISTGTEVPFQAGFRIVAAHTDSPGLRIKPASESTGFSSTRLGVELYGSPIHHTWLDRELCLAGSVSVRQHGAPPQRILFAGESPVAIIANAAIHLNRDVNKGFSHNPQEHLQAIISASEGSNTSGPNAKHPVSTGGVPGSLLRAYLAEELSVDAEAILDFDLFLTDRQPASIIGTRGDMIVSGHLDNLAMCHAAVEALVASPPTRHSRIVALFDGEEIGSRTADGAAAGFFKTTLERVSLALGAGGDDHFRAMAASAMVSGDAAHAIHPSYASKHDEHYQPRLNGGPVIKINASQKYTTTAQTSALFEHICNLREVPVQRIISRSDVSTGSTVGPIISTQLGIPSIDVGHPIWAMHSIRETGGVADHPWMIEALTGFLESEVEWG